MTKLIEDKKIELPFSKKEVLVRQYITAGLWIDIQNNPPREKVRLLIENLVIDFDGDDKDIFNRMKKDLLTRDYILVEKEIMRVLSEEIGENIESKKN